MTSARTPARANPFVGLRPFETGDTHLFFGRDRQIDELLTRLRTERFVAVLGSSGSGKSSLIRAGLLPALEGGLLTSAGTSWRVAILRPGGDPIRNLAEALHRAGVWKFPTDTSDAGQAILEAVLRRGSLGLLEAVHESGLAADDALLVVVDQFEELFRFKRAAAPAARDDASAFVKLLLEAKRHTDRAIHVVLTMRSEFLGNCAEFGDLPQAINEGLFLIPRLNRDQLAQAITGPIAVAGARIAPSLIQRLLNDVGDDPDQLPVLQHVLMRMWDCWPGTDMLTLEHYEKVKGMQEALSEHADEAFHELDSVHRQIAERVFKCLTERGPESREVRRPTPLNELAETTAASLHDVIHVVERFRQEERSFLTPPVTQTLVPETVIDISHESLIRKWKRLREWVNQEAEDRRVYLRVAESAIGHSSGQEPLWRDPRLTWAVQWRDRFKPTEGWARRYSPGLDRAMTFLNRSLEARRSERRRRQAVVYGLIAGVLLVVAAGWAYVAEQSQRQFKEAQAAEKADHERADQQREVEQQRERADLAESQRQVEAEKRLLAEQQSTLDRELALSKGREVETAEMHGREAERLFQRQVVNFADWFAASSSTGAEVAALVALHAFRRAQEGGDSEGIAAARGVLAKNLRLLPLIRWRMRLADPVSNLVVAPGGELLAVDSRSSKVVMWDVTATPPKPLPVAQIDAGAKLVHVIPNGGRIVWTSGQTLRIWNSDSGDTKSLTDPSFERATIIAASFAAGVLVGGNDGTRLWDLTNGQYRLLDADRFSALAFSPDDRMIVGAKPGLVRVWNAETRAQVGFDLPLADPSAPQQIVFSPRGGYFATAAGSSLHVWRMGKDAQEVRQERQVNTQRVNDLAFSRDEQFIATASDDRTAAILKILLQPTLSMSMVARVPHAGPVRRVAFGPEPANLLATGGEDNTTRIWGRAGNDRNDLWRELNRVPHRSVVRALAFLGDRDVATGDGDGWLQAVRVTAGPAMAQSQDANTTVEWACARLSRNLTAVEWNTYFPRQPYQSACQSLPLDPVEVVAAAVAQAAARNQKEAGELFRLAVRLGGMLGAIDDKAKASINNNTCWEGVIHDFADDVWGACEEAVKLDKTEVGHVDSRGVGYALKGDMANALADFRDYVERGSKSRSAEMIRTRERWIQELAAGRNPFAPKLRSDVLKELQTESSRFFVIER